MAANPTVSVFGMRGLTGAGDVTTDDIADDAVTSAKLANDAVSGDIIAALGVEAGKLALGAVSTGLAVASGVLSEYHRTNTTNSVAASRDIAYTDVGDVVACTGPVTLTVPLDMTATTSTGWRLGQFCFIECANASTVTMAAAGGVTLTAPSGLVLDGAGSFGILLRVGTNSWRFHALAGNTFLPVAGIDATGTASSSTILRGDGAWTTSYPRALFTTSAAAGPDSTVTETDLISQSIGARAAGDLIRVRLWGDCYNESGGARTVLVKVKIGATTVITSTAVSLGSNAARREWYMDFDVIVPTTATQQVAGFGSISGADSANMAWSAAGTFNTPFYGTATEDWTTAKTLAVTATLSANDANLDFLCRGSSAVLFPA